MGHLSTKELIYFGAMLLYSQGENLDRAVEYAKDMFNAVFEEKEEPAKDKTIEISDDEILSSVENDSSTTVWANYIIRNNGLYKNVAYAETLEDALEIKKKLENQGFEVEVNYAPKCRKLWE